MDKFVSIQLSRNTAHPLYKQLYAAVKDLILRGVLLQNEALPPIRKFAAFLGVNTVTVVNAYRLLETDGLVKSRIGSGTYVKDWNSKVYNHGMLDSQYQPEYDFEGTAILEHGQLRLSKDAINFASLTPTPELFPVEDFKAIINEVLDTHKGNAFGYQESQGFYPLRESIASYLKNQEIEAHADRIQVISGAQQGIDIIAKSLLHYGDTVITESPTYAGAIAAFKSRGARIIPVTLQNDGINLAELKQKAQKHRPRLIYVMPNFQNPTGVCYSEDKKRGLIELCRQYNMYIIEDDSFTELSYDTAKKTPLKKQDESQNVIFVKSFSKTLMPGLRVAFLLSPPPLIPYLVKAKHTSDISTSGLMQRAFDLYLRKNLWSKHIDFMKSVYQQRYNTMLQTMKAHFPGEVRYSVPGGGLTFWVELPRGWVSSRFFRLCLAGKVIITPGRIFYPEQYDSGQVRLSFAGVYPHEIEKGIEIMGNCLRQVDKTRSEYSPLL